MRCRTSAEQQRLSKAAAAGQPVREGLHDALAPPAIREGDIRLLYDSFGRLPSAQWQPRLQGVETTDPDPEQPPVNPDGSKTEWCGLVARHV